MKTSHKRKPMGMGIHISDVPSTKKDGKTYWCTLVRQSYRDKEEPQKVRKRTLANITHLPAQAISLLRDFFKGEEFVNANTASPMKVLKTTPYGHVHATLIAFKKLKLPELIASKRSKERDLLCAVIASRILRPDSKLATKDWWQEYRSLLADEYPVIREADENDIYAAMDQLEKRQNIIQKKIAKKVLSEGGTVLYDLSSSYFEGMCCPMAKHGYSRDQKPNKVQVNYGLLCDSKGRPVALTCYEGNVHDTQTLMAEIHRLKKNFGIAKVLIVGDRGMITGTRIKELQKIPDVQWITALRKASLSKLLTPERFQMLKKHHIYEWTDPQYPKERLVACYNEPLATKLTHDREHLLRLTEEKLCELQSQQASSKNKAADGAVGVAVGKIINTFKAGKYFEISIKEGSFVFTRRAEKIQQDQARDGIYVIRTCVRDKDAAECVRIYKSLAKVEAGFRILKSELKIRPIYHHKEERVKAHLFLCMLAYYVEWHMRSVWAEFLFTDPDRAKNVEACHPVFPTKESTKALEKKQKKKTPDGIATCRFRVFLHGLGGISKCTYRIRYKNESKHLQEQELQTFEAMPPWSAKQQRALDLLDKIPDLFAS